MGLRYKKNEEILDELLKDQSNRIFVYTDGSCIKFKNGIFKAGYGIYIPQLNIKVSKPLLNQKQIIIFKNDYEQISNKKKEIDKEHIIKYWDKMKKIGNPYELVYTTYNKKRKNDSISDYTPISRSYFKLWEIFHNYDIFKYSINKAKINCAHLAEGPGGFMEASINYLNQLGKKNCFFWGLTLKPNDQYVPDWNKIKKFCKERKNCYIEYGDLYKYNDVLSFVFKLSDDKSFFSSLSLNK